MTRRLAGALALATALAAPLSAQAEEVVVFAAASMKTALDAFAADWSAETGHAVTISYAGSNQLAQQIIQGAPADVFISAAVNWMDEVEKAGLVVNGTRILGNTLVLIAHGKEAAAVEIGAGFDLAGLLGDEKLAMALVDSVPAGQYGKAALTSLGVWDAAGEAPYGIVYATDAAADDNVTIVGTFPADSYPPIVYPAALLTEAADEADRAFFEALTSSDAARSAFEAQGFAVLD